MKTMYNILLSTLILHIITTKNYNVAKAAKEATTRTPDKEYTFTGISPCPNNENISGYSNLNKLNQDMYITALDVLRKNGTQQSEYIYTVCPDTIFDIDEETIKSGTHESIGIYLNNTLLRCGNDDKVFGECVIRGGVVQIAFHPELDVRNAVIKGMTFTSNTGYSVAAYSHPLSDATFINCTWIENEAIYGIVMYYDPDYKRKRYLVSYDDEEKMKDNSIFYNIMNTQHRYQEIIHNIGSSSSSSLSVVEKNINDKQKQNKRRKLLGYPSMSVQFIRCTFSDNTLKGEVINNQGGNLRIIESNFINNIVEFAVVGIAYGGQLSIEGNTNFQDNISPFVPVFIDNDSYLNLNIQNTGSNNLGIACVGGIFLEKPNSYCMEGGKCEGDCCPFGDDTCDRYEPEGGTMIKGEMKAGNPTNDIEEAELSSQNNDEGEYELTTMKAPESAIVTYKDQTTTVAWLRVTVSLLVVALVIVIGLLIFKKKREHAILGNMPDNVLD